MIKNSKHTPGPAIVELTGPSEARRRLLALQTQRQELLTVLKAIMGYVEIEDFSAHDVESCRKDMAAAEALIAKCEGLS